MKANKLLENRLLNYSLTAGTLLCSTGNIFGQLATLTGNDYYDIDFDGSVPELRIEISNSTAFWITKATTNAYFYGSSGAGFPKPDALASVSTVQTNGSKWIKQKDGFASLASGNFNGNFTDKYLAVKFGSPAKYGWVKLSFNGSTLTIHDKAYGNTPPPPLPVELTSFNAVQFENAVKLLWETATEVNNYGFEVQRSANSDQQSVWETIGFVEGHGNSNSPKAYEFIDETAPADNLEYRLKQIDTDGNYEYYSLTAKVDNNVTDIQDNSLPLEFALEQNYPNPFNPSTAISYQLSAVSMVELRVFDLLGKEVATLVNKEQAAGNYSFNFDASGLPSGMYIYRITAGEFTQSRKMLLLR